MIRFEQVSKAFGKLKVLDEISFSVSTGEILFILGKSGQGKSVTLKTIVGLLRPDSGRVFVDDKPVHGMSEHELSEVRKICGMVFQHPALLDSLSIFDNVGFGLRALDAKAKKDRVVECLELVHLNSSILYKSPQQISYGMQKRVSLARTIAPRPRYLLFDEPTTGLDPITTSAVDTLIHELSRKLQVTSIVVSHDMGSALKVSDKILVLDQGKILEHAETSKIRTSTTPLIREFLAEVSH